MLCSPPGVFWSDGSFSSSKSTWRSCGPRVDVERAAGQLRRSRSRSSPSARRIRAESCCSRATSTAIPAASIRASTAIKRPLQLGVEVPEPLGRGPWAPGSPRSARSRRRPRRRTRRPGRRRPGPSAHWFFPLPIRSVIGIIVWSSSRWESWSRLWLRSPLSSR